jgi:hypothetical protein
MIPNYDSGIGATDELSLRVSAATLARVLFKNPRSGDWMLALERKAALHKTENGGVIEIKSQPFGGAIRIHDPSRMRDLIGGFHFDSERSRSEQDFRIFIRPSDWPAVREFCAEHLRIGGDPLLETDPDRELTEEFADALMISLRPDQYIRKPVATLVENDPAPTENIRARGILTARVYRVFAATISDSTLAHAIMKNSENILPENLGALALEDAQKGGKGRANAMLALPLKRISDHYLALPPDQRNMPILFEQNYLEETVPAILEGITVPKYQRLR